MRKLAVVSIILLNGTFTQIIFPQADSIIGDNVISTETTSVNGFVRGGFYSGFINGDKVDNHVSSAFSDLMIRVQSDNHSTFRAFADIRFRYGAEFDKPVNSLTVREAYVKVSGKSWDLSAGQQIIKWGKTDFTNPLSRLSPVNYILRSPEREEMDMGNLLADLKVYLPGNITLEAALAPFYRSSVLIILPVPKPDYIKINEISQLIIGRDIFSYGFRSGFHFGRFDADLTWFEGYDPMPGLELTSFSLDMSGVSPVPSIQMSFKPYKIRLIGADMETLMGNATIRGEASRSFPELSIIQNEYVPFPELDWVLGADYSAGDWRFLIEYSGKSIYDYNPSAVLPVIGSGEDFNIPPSILADQFFNPYDYVKQQVSAFNRLFNYQIKKTYHSTGIRIESDLLYGRVTTAVFSQYNFTSNDLLVIPEVKVKLSDSLTITAGFEYFHGGKNSLYEIIDDFMNNCYAAIRIDF